MLKGLLLVCVLLVSICVALPAYADTVTTYTINFTTTASFSGTPSPTGSFTYDSTNPLFSNFLVTWDGVTYDLTASANGPTLHGSGCTGESATAGFGFGIMSQALTGCGGPVSYGWQAANSTQNNENNFFVADQIPSQSSSDVIANVINVPPPSATNDGAYGTFTITPQTPVSAAPEPSSLYLLGSSLFAFGMLGLKFRSSKSA